MFEIKNSHIMYYDAEARCEHPVIEIASVEGMIFGIVKQDKQILIVCRWDKRFTPNGYPVGRRGPCWMSMPVSMTQYILDGLYIAVKTQDEASILEEFIAKNFKNYTIDLQGSSEKRYVKKHNISTKTRTEETV